MSVTKEQSQLEQLRKIPDTMLYQAVLERAKAGLFSETHLLELAGTFYEAAEEASERRGWAETVPRSQMAGQIHDDHMGA